MSFVLVLLVLHSTAASTATLVRNAAEHFYPEARWRESSAIRGNFTCSGQRQWAILGATASEILVAVFIRGTTKQPEILRYAGSQRSSANSVLAIESLDYDPKIEIGSDLPGFVRSRSCQGLNLSDGQIDSAHIYWNRIRKQFADWVR